MCMKKYLFILFLIYIGIVSVYAQTRQTEICIDFRVGSSRIDPTYMDNENRLSEILSYIDRLHSDTTLKVTKLVFSGVSSPEGSLQINKRLANKRLLALEDYVRSRITLPDSLVLERNDTYIPWNYLIGQVEHSDIAYRDEVLTILKGESRIVPYTNGTTIDSRIPALKSLDNGKVWNILNQRYFTHMRNACAIFIDFKSEPEPEPEPEPDPIPVPVVADTLETVVDTVAAVVIPEPETWVRRLHLKTNTVGWAMLIANIGVEVDLAPRWSFQLPIYFSAMNYFTSKVKFRTFALQPELRHWFSPKHEGWFAGAHLGLAWFNYAKGGNWRYQDHHRHSPIYGGGLDAGYRKPISKDGRWLLEFSLGTGIYHLNYDIFHNEPNGQLVGSRERTFYGIDHVGVSFVYRFDLKKKGTRK